MAVLGSGGISVPIGSGVDLLDTANTVTRGGETFLKNGQLSTAATYPNSPVRNFFGAGTLTTKELGSATSPFGTDTTPGGSSSGYGQLIAHNSMSASALRATTSYNDNMYVLEWDSANLYCYRFTNTGSGTATYVARKLINDGTILPTGGNWSMGASMMQAHMWGMTYRYPTSITGNNLNGNAPTVGADRIGVCLYTEGYFRIAILSGDMQTHIVTLLMTPKASWFQTQAIRVLYVNVGAANDTLTADKFYVCWMNSSNHFVITRYPAPTSTQVSNGGNQTLTYANEVLKTFSDHAPQFYLMPELWPWYASQEANPAACGRVGIRGSATDIASNAQRLLYYDVDNDQADGYSGGGVSFNSAYDANIPVNITSYNSPHIHKTNTAPCIMQINQLQLQSRRFDSLSTIQVTLPGAFSTSGYTGYVYTSSTNIYFGHSNENKIFAINPSTLAQGTAISTSSQAAPYRLTWHNNVLYNLNGTNIHTYNTSNASFVATTAISDEFSGTNASGIGTDGTYIYVVDKSNSRVYKYTIANMAATPTYVTLSDNPHGLTGTIDGMAIDGGKIYINRNSQLFVYNLADGVYGEAFKASMGSGDVDVHDSNIVVASGTIQQTAGTVQLDKVGHPTEAATETTSTYTRVA